MSSDPPKSYVDRLYEILTPEERARANALIGEAMMRHDLDADFDKNHPVLGVLSESVFHCQMADRTAARTQRLFEDVVLEGRRIADTVKKLEHFVGSCVDRIGEAEKNAFNRIHEPRHIFERNLMKEYDDLKKPLSKEIENLREAASTARSNMEALGLARMPRWKAAACLLIACVGGMVAQSFLTSGPSQARRVVPPASSYQ